VEGTGRCRSAGAPGRMEVEMRVHGGHGMTRAHRVLKSFPPHRVDFGWTPGTGGNDDDHGRSAVLTRPLRRKL
jgi:uncharacterized protein YndB with AHSA1/START domain